MIKVAIERWLKWTDFCLSNYLDGVGELRALRVDHLDPEGGNYCIRSEGGDQDHDQGVRDLGGLRVQDTPGNCHQSYL